MSERGFDLKRDGTGILIFSVAAFFAVLICKAWSSESLANATGTAVLADIWVSSLGVLPSLLVTGGLAFVGARMFLRADNSGWLRTAGALALTAVALSILLGAFSATAGGKIGAAIGGSISSFTHVSVGVLVGVAALAFVVKAAWLRPVERADVESPTLLSTKKALKRDVADGVTRDEALALLPEDLNQEPAAVRILEPVQSKAMPPSPYPVDVRLRGEIPAGAKPLQPKHVPAPPESAHEAHSVYRWTAPVVEEPALAPRADLARNTEPELEPEPEPEPGLQALSVTEEWQDEQDLTDEDRFPVEAVVEEVTPVPIPPRPSWEQPSLFEADDERVDAYGTPLTLIESLRAPEATTSDEIAELAGEKPSEIAEDPLAAVAETRLDDEQDAYEEEDEADAEDEDDDEEADDEDAEDEALDDDDDEEAEDDDEDEDAEDEDEADEVDEELVEEVHGAAPSTKGIAADDEDQDEDEPEDEADDDETERVAAQQVDAARVATKELESPELETPELETPELETDELETDELETDEELAAEIEREPLLAAELHPAVETPSMVAARMRKDEAPASRVFEAVPMRDVVLQPKRAPADKADRAKVVGGTRNELLAEAGCLFLDRGRVAVSMLQRQYSMDFDEACALLDELQQMGLIGPYLGGQRRDILMTREQWLERVGAEAGGQAPRLADV